MGDPAPTVRPARAADSARLAEQMEALEHLHARAQPAFFRTPDPSLRHARAQRLRSAFARTRERWLVAEIDSRLAGMARVALHDAPADPSLVLRRRGHLDTLWIEPWARRHGAGRALVEAAERWARERGAAQLVLTVWAGNDEALRFYERLGYGTASRAMAKDLA